MERAIAQTPVDVASFYEEIIPGAMPGFAPRKGQADLSELILDTMIQGGTVLAEAPTGFGKSFAVLVPSIIAALQEGKRIVISTETLVLQDQYVNKDLPLLKAACAALGLNFGYAVAKGRSNFVCRLKLDEIDYSGASELMEWAKAQRIWEDTGDIGSVPFAFDQAQWECVGADEDCERAACPFYGQGRRGLSECFVYEAQKRFMDAQIVVANHTLVLLDLAQEAGSVLGGYDTLIVDEAHSFASKAQDCWGTSIKPHTVSRTMSLINKMLSKVGVNIFAPGFREEWREYEGRLFAPFASVEVNTAIKQIEPRLVDQARAVAEEGAEKLRFLNRLLNDVINQPETDPQTVVIRACKEKIGKLTGDLLAIFGDKLDPDWAENWLTFVEVAKTRKGDRFAILNLKPIQVAPLMRSYLFEVIRSRVFMSATLRIGKSFGFTKRELGVPDGAQEFIGESPFDFESNVLGYFPKHLPDPNRPEYLSALADEITRVVEHTQGRALILFTNNSHMRYCYEQVRQRTSYTCYVQGEASRPLLIERFKNDVHSCLFASRSFFSGVDFPGETCSAVVMTKAPFEVPTEPMFRAKCDKIEEAGDSSFALYALPMMLFQIRQAHGRLIRTTTDNGVFAFLDSRAMSKSYGTQIIKALPAMPVVSHLGEGFAPEQAAPVRPRRRVSFDNFDE